MANFKPVLFFILFFSCSAHSAIISYTNQADWLAALPEVDFSLHDFNGDANSFAANSMANTIGDLSLSLLGGAGDPGPTGLTGKGYLQAEVDSNGSDQLSLDISFANAYGFALGGLQNDSLSSPSNLNLKELAIVIGSQSWVLSDLIGQSKSDIPFLGFVSDSEIDAFQFVHASLIKNQGGTSEEFYLDQLTLALSKTGGSSVPNPTPSAVPEPPVPALLAVGLLLLITVKNLRQPING